MDFKLSGEETRYSENELEDLRAGGTPVCRGAKNLASPEFFTATSNLVARFSMTEPPWKNI